MATRKQQTTEETTETKEETTAMTAEEIATEEAAELALSAEGFKSVKPTEMNYYKVLNGKEKVTLRGIPLKRKARPAGDGFYYIIGLTADCVLFNREGEPVETKAGPDSFAWVDERSELACLQEQLPREMPAADGTYGIVQCSEVVITPLRKKDLTKGRKMWLFKVQARVISPNLPNLPLLAPATSVAPSPALPANEDVPF